MPRAIAEHESLVIPSNDCRKRDATECDSNIRKRIARCRTLK